ncbi:MAG: phosphoribosylaminoimidazolesuccinocarboxamide synthase [Candidatus Aenigmarchaeota archaeon]|nr:phosphoribosylaminoimidazolesuccinocarboxamide synthase [Candidatus Aenigmarchaeota archaeon]
MDVMLRNQLNNTLAETSFSFGKLYRGKVRDNYTINGRRIIICTDRLSAFDKIICTIPFKGQVLNQLAAFWFNETRRIAKNHLIEMPDANAIIAKECKPIPIEMIVRRYITGVTKTSLWFNYSKGERKFFSAVLPNNLKKDQKLGEPIITPTTKMEKHDRNLSRNEIEKFVPVDIFRQMEETSFRLFEFGSGLAESRGLILVDTKYEFGLCDGELTLIDEMHTPDSSRFWFANTYEKLFSQGQPQRELDKEYVRRWLASKGFLGEGPVPAVPEDVRIEAAKRYIEAFEILTDKKFEPDTRDASKRIEKNLMKKGYIE